MATQLEILAEKYRKEVLGVNSYNDKNFYSSVNKNALSDGDLKGKGDVEGQVGSSVDIQNRIDNMSRNRYNNTNEYSMVNKNALSDGDEFGKGQIGDNGQVGSLTDIKTRNTVLGKNPTYGPDKKQYPDF
jgi:hypothetical protein